MNARTHDHVSLQRLEIKVAGDGIAASFCRPTGASAGIVFVHGWDGCKEQHAECIDEVVANGFACLAFDLRGHQGTCELHDQVDRADNLRDLLRMYDWLADQGIDRIGLIGVSYGAYLAALATEVRPVRWLVLRAPALYPDRGWHRPKDELGELVDLRKYREQVHAPEDSESLAACAGFEGHALIVESGCDEVIPHPVILSYAQAFLSAKSMTCTTIDGADHELSETRHRLAFARMVGDWLAAAIRDPDGACPDESVVA
jgi:pimeloyl-ACP methyl ester carboxylesterase